MNKLPGGRILTPERAHSHSPASGENSAGRSPGDLASRVGSVPYLNAAPLTYGLEDRLLFAAPSRLASLLQAKALDAALVSTAEVLLTDGYDVLDGVAIASRGEVKSVLLAHRGPLAETREVYCDPASLTGVNLVRVLLAEQGLRPVFRPLGGYAEAARHDFVLLIGDPALDFVLAGGPHHIWDLGTAWQEHTRLPFVYAVWALRREADTGPLRQELRAAKERGMACLAEIVRTRPEYDLAFRRTYLGGNILYELGPEEKRGLLKFAELLRKHTGQAVYEPRYVK